jgi:hypothetical protein
MKAAGMAFLLAAGFGLAIPGQAQSLGDAAKKERERRAKQAKEPAKTYSDDDLLAQRGDGSKPSASPSPAASPSAAPPAESDRVSSVDAERAERKTKEAEWRVRFANARERVSVAEADGWYDTVETVFVSGIPVQQRVRKFQETDELRQARQALADLEEEYRRTGLPPGWIRN